jgi:hypothetical protein
VAGRKKEKRSEEREEGRGKREDRSQKVESYILKLGMDRNRWVYNL